MKLSSIAPRQVRYIKLGEGGGWGQECLNRNIIRFGFGTASPTRISMCLSQRWNDLVKALIEEGHAKGTATNIANQTRSFFEDNGTTLWITFINEKLYWAFLDPHPPKPHDDDAGTWRKVVDGWRSIDIKGKELTKDRLSGALTKLAGFRGTSCNVDAEEYVVRRINCEETPELKRVAEAVDQLKLSVPILLKRLDPYDFETLVDLIFSTGGWRRLGQVGGTQETKDIDLELPATNERILVQIKSETTSMELAEYIDKLDSVYDRMFYVHHSGTVETSDKRVFVIGPEKLAKLVFDAGLVNWLVGKSC